MSKIEFLNVSTNLLLKKQHCKSKQMTWSTWSFIFIQYSCTEWSTWFFSCQNAVLQFDIICSLILCVIWYCLHSFILFFLFNLNCAFINLYIFKLKHTLLILYFLHYIVIKNDDIFQKKTFVTNMMLSQINWSEAAAVKTKNDIHVKILSWFLQNYDLTFSLYYF